MYLWNLNVKKNNNFKTDLITSLILLLGGRAWLDGESNLNHLRTNFINHFTCLGSTFISAWSKRDYRISTNLTNSPLLIHLCYYIPAVKAMLIHEILPVLVIIFWNFSVFSYRSVWPQVKRNLISRTTNFVYELNQEFPNDLRSYEIRKC